MTAAGPRAPIPSDFPLRAARLLVLGLGNELCSDDAIGLLVVRELARLHALSPAGDGRVTVEFHETTGAGLALLDELAGYERAIVIDAVRTGKMPVGTLLFLDDVELPRVTVASVHFLGVGETLGLGRALGLSMPEKVRVAAIEVADPYTIGTRLSPALAAARPQIVACLGAMVEEETRSGGRSLPPSPTGGLPCPTR